MPDQNKTSELLRDFFVKLETESSVYSTRVLQNDLAVSSKTLKILEEQLIDLVKISTESKFNLMIEKIQDKYRAFDRLSADLDEPFSLFVMGMDKIGKSTLINALIGKSIAEDTLSNTWKIDVYRGINGGGNQVEILQKNKESVFLKREDAIGYIKDEDVKINDFKNEIKSKYILKQKEYFGNNDAINELREELKKELLNVSSDIYEVRWPTEKNELLKNITVVDTPGIKQELLGEVVDCTSEYYYRSDGALWIIDSNELLSEENLNINFYDNYPYDRKEVIGVINMIDSIKKNGGKEAVEKVILEANKVYGDKFKVIVPISAKEAIIGILEDDDRLIERSGINRLKREIESCFLRNENEIKLESKKQGATLLLDNLLFDIKNFVEELKSKHLKRNEMKHKFELEIDDKKSSLLEYVETVINEYVEDVKNNIDEKSERLFEMEGDFYPKLYLENNIFSIEKFENQFTNLKKEILDSLCLFYKYNLDKSIFTKYEYIDENDLRFKSFNSVLSPSVDYAKDNASDVCDLDLLSEDDISSEDIMNFGQMVSILDEIADRHHLPKSVAKKKKLPMVKSDLSTNLESMISELKERLSKDIEKKLKNISKNINTSLEASFERLYCNVDSVEDSIKIFEVILNKLDMPTHRVSVKDIITGKLNS